MTERELGTEGTGAAPVRPTSVMERLARMLAESAEKQCARTRLKDALLKGDFSLLFELGGDGDQRLELGHGAGKISDIALDGDAAAREHETDGGDRAVAAHGGVDFSR